MAFAEPILTERTFEQAIARIVEGIERSRLRVGDRTSTAASRTRCACTMRRPSTRCSAERAAGYALACQSHPASDRVTLDFDQ